MSRDKSGFVRIYPYLIDGVEVAGLLRVYPYVRIAGGVPGYPVVAHRLRALREAKRWSQEELARRASTNKDTVNSAENPSRNPTWKTLVKITAALGTTIPAVTASTRDNDTTDHPRTTIEGFVALPLLANPIAAGQPLAIAPDPDRDRTLSFRETVVRKFTRPICLRIGPREESMLPTLEPGDVVVIDQNPDRRRAPKAGHIYAVNFGALTGDDGGAVKRIDLSGSTLVVTSDNMDKRAYPPQVFNVTDVNLLDALVGEVVWTGRYLGSGKKADVRNMKRKRSSA